MKKTVIYRLDNDDRVWARDIEEAFNRVIQYCPELRARKVAKKDKSDVVPSPLVRFNRIVCNGEFDRTDVFWLNHYSHAVYDRVLESLGKGRHPIEIEESIEQAAENLVTVTADFQSFVEAS